MSLQVWLPFTSNNQNQGLYPLPKPSKDSYVENTDGKMGRCITGNAVYHLSSEPFTKQWSLCCWIKLTAFSESGNSPFFVKNIGNTATSNTQIYAAIYDDDYLRCYGEGRDGSASSCTYHFQVNTWYHIAIVCDNSQSTGKIKYYINGTQVGNEKTYTYSEMTGNSNLGILTRGTNNAGTTATGNSSRYGNDFRLYDHCLSAKEVEEIAKGLVLHYKLDEPNPNLITQAMLNAAPWATAIKAHEVYQGKMAYRIQNSTLHSNTSSGTTTIFPGIIFEENTQYTFSIDWRDDYRTDDKNSSLYFKFQYSDNSTATVIISPSHTIQAWTHTKMTSANGKTVTRITTTYAYSGQLYIANLKLEKGSIETAYIGLGDQINNSIIYDCSGYQNNGTIVGNLSAAAPSPRYEVATYIASGNTDYITSPTMYLPGDQITMNFWFKSSNKSPGSSFHIPLAGTANSNQSYEMSIHSSGYLRGGLVVAGTRKVDNCTSTKLIDGNWHMCTMTYDGATIKRYVDAVMEKSTAATGALATTTQFVLGHYGSNTSYYSKETYTSDVRIYTTALTEAQVTELYNTSMSVDSSGNIYARELREV